MESESQSHLVGGLIRDAGREAEATLQYIQSDVLPHLLGGIDDFRGVVADLRQVIANVNAYGIAYEISAEFAGHQAPVKIKGTLWPGGRPQG